MKTDKIVNWIVGGTLLTIIVSTGIGIIATMIIIIIAMIGEL